jgi:hypothetical protein
MFDELTTVFGNCSAPANFDDFVEAVVQLAKTVSKITR